MFALQLLLLTLSTLPLSLADPLMPIQLVTTSTSTTPNPIACPTATITAPPSVKFHCLDRRIACVEPDKRCIELKTTTIPCDCPAVMPTVTVAGPACGGCAVGCGVSWETVTAKC